MNYVYKLNLLISLAILHWNFRAIMDQLDIHNDNYRSVDLFFDVSLCFSHLNLLL